MTLSFVLQYQIALAGVDNVIRSRPAEVDRSLLTNNLLNFALPALGLYIFIGTICAILSHLASGLVANRWSTKVWGATWATTFGALSLLFPHRLRVSRLTPVGTLSDWLTTSLLSAPEATIFSVINSEWSYSLNTPLLNLESNIPAILATLLGGTLGLMGGRIYNGKVSKGVRQTRGKPTYTPSNTGLSNIKPAISLTEASSNTAV